MLIRLVGAGYAVKYARVMGEISSISNKISAISGNLSEIQTVHDELGGLATHSNTALTFSQSVSDGRLSLTDNMTEVTSHIKSISDDDAAIFVKIQLGTANKDWQNVLDQARTLGIN